MNVKNCLAFWFLSISYLTVFAQNENNFVEDSIIHVDVEKKVIWDASFSFKTMNVFRGLIPSRAPVFAAQAGLKVNDFILGFYGGASTNAYYTETDLILMYYRPKFSVRADWYYNFTEGITNIPTPSGFFDLDPETTRGLLDFMVNYNITENFELISSTLLYGRDRPALPEDIENDVLLRRGKQRYSQYFALQYIKKINKIKLTVHAGYSYSWADPSGATFYYRKPGFNDIGASITRNIIDSETISLPLKVSLTLNPLTNNLYLMATMNILELSKIK